MLFGRAVTNASALLVTADEQHELELGDDAAPRAARDTAAEVLYDSVIELREVGTGLLGAAALKTLKLEGTTPRDPPTLKRYVANVVHALREAKLPKSRVRGATFHASEWADRLDEELSTLAEAMKDVDREAREAEATLRVKTAAMAAFDAAFTRTSTVTSALLAAVGEHELADRVRPSHRRPGRTADSHDAPPAAPGAATPAHGGKPSDG